MTLTRTPVNLITGFLGAGKTTTILGLLATRPAGERWAVLVNEFGKVRIDVSTLEDGAGGVVVREVSGCICCTGQIAMRVVLTRLLRETRPDRLLIEPGLGHLSGIINFLQDAQAMQALDLRATVCIIDPRQYSDPDIAAREDYREQIRLADVLVINGRGPAAPEEFALAKRAAAGFSPAKITVFETGHEKLDPALLDANACGKK
ncbi:MAG TPA: GTP-binding protein [Burkholderiales bacterium]|nr:GTP-binding protein [Burkholderiales bacterium]